MIDNIYILGYLETDKQTSSKSIRKTPQSPNWRRNSWTGRCIWPLQQWILFSSTAKEFQLCFKLPTKWQITFRRRNMCYRLFTGKKCSIYIILLFWVANLINTLSFPLHWYSIPKYYYTSQPLSYCKCSSMIYTPGGKNIWIAQ